MSFFENGCVLQRKHVRQTQPKSKLFTNTVIIKVIIQKDMNWMIVLTTISKAIILCVFKSNFPQKFPRKSINIK